MLDIYLICAALGGTILVVQLLLNLFGLGHHDIGGLGDGGHDAGGHDHDAHGSSYLWLLSSRAIVAAVAFFGLAGIAAGKYGCGAAMTGALAGAAGLTAMVAVASSMRFFSKLQSDGTARIEQSIGASGSVYLTIPAQKSGSGKISVAVQDRNMEYLAVTSGDALPTGTGIVVVDIVGPDTVEVEGVTNEQMRVTNETAPADHLNLDIRNS